MIHTFFYQYADGTELFLEGDRNSVEEAILTTNDFGKKSGLFLNTGKTNAVWLGSKINSPVRYMPHMHMEWNPQRFKILGILLTNDLRDCELINFHERWAEIKTLYKIVFLAAENKPKRRPFVYGK